MKRIIGTAALALLLAATAWTPPASAQCVTGTGTNILLKWDTNGFSTETPAPSGYVSAPGAVLTNALAVSLFCAPLSFLNPNDPGTEYTMVWTGLVSHGTAVSPIPLGGSKYNTIYTGGTFLLYAGPVNARPFTSSTVPPPGAALPLYTDGSVILSGPIDTLFTSVTVTGLGNVNGSFRGTYRITGGTYANLFCNNHPVPALLDGLWYPVTPPPGWTGHNNGKFDGPDCTTPAVPSTWGRIKSLYR